MAERKQNEERWATRFAVTRILGESRTFGEAAPQLLQVIGVGTGCEYGQLWRVDVQANQLRWEQGWEAPTLDLGELTQRSQALAFSIGDGLPGRVWASAQPEWVADITTDASPQATLAVSAGLRSSFAFPIRNDGAVLGVMVVFSSSVRPLDAALLAIAADIGSQIGQFLERTKAEERLKLYARRLETLHAIDRAALAAQSPQAIAQAALHFIRQLVACRRASILAFDFAADEAEIWAAEADRPTDLRAGMRFQIAEIASVDTLQQGRLFVMHDLRELANPSPLYKTLLKEGIVAYISMPIVVQADLIAALNLASDQPGTFVPEYLEIARDVAAQLGVAMQNLRLFEQVRVGRERLQRLSLQLVQTQESERRQIARELHDEIGQSLTAVQLNLQVLLGITDLRELPTRLEDSLALIDRVLQQVRALSLDLRPSMLDDLGLVPALRWYLNRQAERAGFSVELHTDQTAERFAPDVETTCFRIAQEALNNIVRYAQAKYVVVELHQRDKVLHLTISDDGVGFDVAAALQRAATGRSLGLVSMQERAVLLGGMIQFDSAPDRGTTIFVRLPLATSREAARQIERRSSSR
jgi:signal transduction histidine kinase